jgi:hypothetical protein
MIPGEPYALFVPVGKDNTLRWPSVTKALADTQQSTLKRSTPEEKEPVKQKKEKPSSGKPTLKVLHSAPLLEVARAADLDFEWESEYIGNYQERAHPHERRKERNKKPVTLRLREYLKLGLESAEEILQNDEATDDDKTMAREIAFAVDICHKRLCRQEGEIQVHDQDVDGKRSHLRGQSSKPKKAPE